jgi:hypothetical protein
MFSFEEYYYCRFKYDDIKSGFAPIVLNKEDAVRFLEMLENPREPSDEVKARLRKVMEKR